jgi:hexosaminidase
MFTRVLAVVSIFVTAALALVWPAPVEIETGSEILWLAPGVPATLRCGDTGENQFVDQDYIISESHLTRLFDGVFQYAEVLAIKFQFPLVDKSRNGERYLSEDSILKEAVRDTIKSIHSSRFVPWKLHKRNTTFEPDLLAARHYISRLQLQLNRCPGSGPLWPESFFGADESYEVLINNATVSIKSNSTLGSIRGLQTLRQLFFAHSSSTGAYTPFVPVKIVDRPKWGHRGLSLDIARNPFEPKDLLRTIDALALAKMSRLHIHATDSQSWPLEIPSLPMLARNGAYHPDLVWTAASLRESKFAISLKDCSSIRGIVVFVPLLFCGLSYRLTEVRSPDVRRFEGSLGIH